MALKRLNSVFIRCVLLVSVMFSCLGAASPAAAQYASFTGCSPIEHRTMENLVHELMNQQRRAHGLNPLIRMQFVDAIAQDWSGQMLVAGELRHRPSEDFTRVTLTGGALGENIIGWGMPYFHDITGPICNVQGSAQLAMDVWM